MWIRLPMFYRSSIARMQRPRALSIRIYLPPDFEMKVHNISIYLLMFVSLAACSRFSRLQKENDLEKKFAGALEYYEEGDCLKSSILLEELIPLYRGTEKSEQVYYYHAKSTYCDKDYILANYYFKNFVKTFPQSTYAEECSYMAAYCLFLESPQYSLDQSDTEAAINALQLHLNDYPQTNKKDTINVLIADLRSKLERKSYEHAKQYHRTRRFKSAVIALENALNEYPDSRYREEMFFLLLSARFELAVNSIESKKKERLQNAIDTYHTFVDYFADSQYLKEAESLYDRVLSELEALNASR